MTKVTQLTSNKAEPCKTVLWTAQGCLLFSHPCKMSPWRTCQPLPRTVSKKLDLFLALQACPRTSVCPVPNSVPVTSSPVADDAPQAGCCVWLWSGRQSQHHGPRATHSAGAFWAPPPIGQAGFWLRPGVRRSPGPTEPLPTQTQPCWLALLLSASQASCPLPGLGTFPRACSAPSCSPATASCAVAEWGSSWSPLSTLEEDGPHMLCSLARINGPPF